MKRSLMLLVVISILLMGGQAFAFSLYGNAGPDQNLLGGGGGTAFNQTGTTPLPAGCVVQYIYAGPDGIIQPPTNTGGTTGDDAVVTTKAVGDDNDTAMMYSGIPGYFYHSYIGTYTSGTPQVYCRTYNSSSISSASYYGNSALFTPITNNPAPLPPNDVALASWSTIYPFTPPAGTPNITGIIPVAGVSGTRITIYGSNFGASAGTVTFAVLPAKTTTAAGSIVGWSTGVVTVDAPASTVGKCEISLTNTSALTGTWSTFYHTVPYTASIVPTSGVAGTVITLTGSNFATATTLHFNGSNPHTPAFVVSGGGTIITFTSPTIGVFNEANNVYVTNPSGDSNIVTFTITSVPPTPTFTSITANSGAQGATVASATILATSTSFNGTSTVEFSGAGVTSEFIAADSTTQLRIKIYIQGSAAIGARNVIIRTGSEVVTGTGAFTVSSASNVAPNSPISGTMNQYKSDGTTVIANQGWTNENSVILRFSMSDTNNPDTLTPVVEIKTDPTAFDGTGLLTGTSVGVTGSAVTGSYTMAGLTDGSSYSWRARVQDSATATSAWVDYNATKPNFRIDTTVPVVSATVPNNLAIGVAKTTTSVQVTFTEASSGLNLGASNANLVANATVIGSISGAHPVTTVTGTGVGPFTINFTGALTDESVTVTLATPAIKDNAGNALSAIGNSWSFATGTGVIDDRLYDFRTHGRQMAAYPNPFNPNDTANPLTMPIGADTDEAISIYILDTNGRVVWKHSEALNATRIIHWDGETSYGEVVENGLYILRAVKGGSEVISKGRILVIKK